jgi:homoserine dehydrogenase
VARRAGRPLKIVAVAARTRREVAGARWLEPLELARGEEIDVVVEAIGGAEGVARQVAEAALAAGKHLVTANKALLAVRGAELARAAERAGVALMFEAAVAGGVPILKALREGLVGNRFARVYGILNGTCNYILTQMQERSLGFAQALAEAQAEGYAEADPSFDVDGVDAAHKLAILASVAFGAPVSFAAVHVEGIRDVEAIDIAFARELECRIKLLAIARRTADGLEQRVHPCMVSANTPIAHVDGVFNAVVAEGDFVGRTVFEGRGAGAGPTASAVVADLVDIARGRVAAPFSVASAALENLPASPMSAHVGPYYVRLTVLDQPGVIADISAILRDERISIESLIQRGRAREGEGSVPVVMVTHETQEAAMLRALERIGRLSSMRDRPKMIRMEVL